MDKTLFKLQNYVWLLCGGIQIPPDSVSNYISYNPTTTKKLKKAVVITQAPHQCKECLIWLRTRVGLTWLLDVRLCCLGRRQNVHTVAAPQPGNSNTTQVRDGMRHPLDELWVILMEDLSVGCFPAIVLHPIPSRYHRGWEREFAVECQVNTPSPLPTSTLTGRNWV